MKLRVVDWVDYDDDFPEGDNGWAARNAIIDDIRKHNYDFSGWAHQEGSYCTPLLNDGKKYCYSQRGWGDVMAEAHEDMSNMGYAKFIVRDEIDEMFMSSSERFAHRPKCNFYDEEPETDLNETFEAQVTPAQFRSAAKQGAIGFVDYQNYRYIYQGDKLVLHCGDKSAEFLVSDAERMYADEVEQRSIRGALNDDDLVLVVSLEPLQ